MQVSHHPPVGAAHAENKDWEYDMVSAPTTKFLGNSIDIYPIGQSLTVAPPVCVCVSSTFCPFGAWSNVDGVHATCVCTLSAVRLLFSLQSASLPASPSLSSRKVVSTKGRC